MCNYENNNECNLSKPCKVCGTRRCKDCKNYWHTIVSRSTPISCKYCHIHIYDSINSSIAWNNVIKFSPKEPEYKELSKLHHYVDEEGIQHPTKDEVLSSAASLAELSMDYLGDYGDRKGKAIGFMNKNELRVFRLNIIGRLHRNRNWLKDANTKIGIPREQLPKKVLSY